MKFVNVVYTEGAGQDSYECIEVYNEDDKITYFQTGDFVEDYQNMMTWLTEENEMTLHSSSLDNFFSEEPMRYLPLDDVMLEMSDDPA